MKFTKGLFTAFFSIFILLGLIPDAMSQGAAPGPTTLLYGTDEDANTSVPPPPMLPPPPHGRQFRVVDPQFMVTYHGFTDEARAAFQYAVDIWGSLIRSPVTIRIDATFANLETGTLGQAGPNYVIPSREMYFADALADKRAGQDVGNGRIDIEAEFNSNEQIWYFGTDGNTPSGKYDFVSVVLHEIGHGLGITSARRIIERFFGYEGALRIGEGHFPTVYDTFVVNGAGTVITNFADPSTTLLEQFTGNSLYWNGSNGKLANSGTRPKLFAPTWWIQGSSYVHLDEETYRSGDLNSLMTPYFDRAEAIHNPGPISLGILDDMGWTINKAPVIADDSTTRSVAENTAADVDIGSAVAATDANNADTDDNTIDTLTYLLSGTDAASFDIDPLTGQLKTRAALDYEVKSSYTVTVIASDGSLTDSTTVIVDVADVDETPTNSVPVFSEGSATSRTVAENTGAGMIIGGAVAATDADNDTLIYTLSGTDASSFDIDRTSGQLKTSEALDYETKIAYTVTISVSDDIDTASITVTVGVSDVNEAAPVFSEGTTTARAVAENTGARENIGSEVAATDADNDTLTYTLSGTDAYSFDIDRTSGQLKTRATLDYETKAVYTVMVTASDGSLENQTTVTINVTDVDEAPANSAPEFSDGSTASRTVAENTAATVNIGNAVFATDPDNDTLTYTLSGTDASSFDIDGTSGQLKTRAALDYETKAVYTVMVTASDGSLEDQTTVTITVTDVDEVPVLSICQVGDVLGPGESCTYPDTDTEFSVLDDGGARLDNPELPSWFNQISFGDSLNVTATVNDVPYHFVAEAISGGSWRIDELGEITVPPVDPANLSVTASPTLTEATLNGGVVTLTLSGSAYSRFSFNAVTVSGITGVTASDVERVSDTEVNVQLAFNGNIDTDGTLTFTVGANAIAGYDGAALTARVSVTALAESVVASTSPPLTERTLNGSVVTLTLNGGTYQPQTTVRNNVTVSGIAGVTVGTFDVDRVSDTQVTIELTFDGTDFDSNTTLTFTVGADAIAGYDGAALTAGIPVTALAESVIASTPAPLTEGTLNESVITLTLTGGIYERQTTVRNNVTVSGITGVTVGPFDVERASDTVVTLELTFDGTDLVTDTNLTFTIGAGAIVGYSGSALSAQIPVSATSNSAPVFSEGRSTTRTVAENTGTGVNIGNAVLATDPDNDTLAYTLSGTDASSFDIDRTSGQLTTRAALDYESKASYTVVIAASDGSLEDSITVTINVTDVDEALTNNAPAFSEGTTTARSVAENTGTGVNIGSTVTATDADNDTLTYTLSGTDAAAFDIDRTTGQLKTRAALDYETKRAYTVTVIASDGSLTASITVTITISNANDAPVFTAGGSTSRTVAENTALSVNIGSAVAATDADNDTLTYTLNGIDASSFDIDRTSGQLKTRAALDYETKTSYMVTITVSDGSLTDTITVTINVTNVPETPMNRAPVFSEGNTATRTLAENTVAGVNIGNAVLATDPDNDTLTYTLSGTDAASFDIERTSGQLRTRAALDYESKTSYIVTMTVSDGSLTDSITATINVSNLDDQASPTITLESPPLTERTLNGRVVTLTLSNRIYERWLSDLVTVSGIDGVTIRPFDVERVSDTVVTVELSFDGTDFDTGATLTFTVGAGVIASYNGPALTDSLPVAASQESVVASPKSLSEATLNGSVVTLTLSGGVYESRFTVGNYVTVSGIPGVTFRSFDVDRVSDTVVTVELRFDGTDFDTDATLTFSVGAGAIENYSGPAFTVAIPVAAVVEETPRMTASSPQPLTETTLDESMVTLTLSSGAYAQSSFDVSSAVTVSGINGVSLRRFDVERVSDTVVTAELTFDGTDFDTDATLTFSVEAGAIESYNGPALTAAIAVIAVEEENPTLTVSSPQPLTEGTLDGSEVSLTLSNGIYAQSSFDISRAVTVDGIDGVTVGTFGVDRVSDTEVSVELEFNGNIDTDATLTFSVGADAITGYNGPALLTQVSVTGGQESVTASTEAPLTETTLNGSVATLTLSGGVYEQSTFDLRGDVTVDGIDGVTIHWFDLDRVSDTEVTVELTFVGNIDTDATLTFSVGADAITGYNGPALTAQLPVTAGQESVTASTEAPLTETTLDGSVVTLTLNGAKYARSIFNIRDAVTVAGFDGVTIPWHQPDRESDTVITVELEFNGDIDTDATLTFSVGADALAGYNGPALTAQLPVTAGQESVIASTETPLTEATLAGSVVTLTLSDGVYAQSIFDIRDAVTVSGIDGVTIPWHQPDRESDTVITVELEFSGDFDTEATLTFSVGADALAGYNGPALTAQLPVTAGQESVTASIETPLTEATLNESVVTLTLNGAIYARSIFDIRDAVTVAGIDGVTIPWHQPDRESDTQISVELEFDGNDFDADATLTFTVKAEAIASYNGPGFTVQIPVTANTESVVASSASPLTEATLNESVVTLTLNGAIYARSIFDIRDAVTVAGIDGVTIPWHQPDRESDTQISVELEFDGNISTDATLTFTVGADAIADYNGAALTAEIPVTAGPEGDANQDGVVDIQDLVSVASNFQQTGQNNADVNGDGIVDVKDLLIVAGVLENAAAAPSLHSQSLTMLTAADIQGWLAQARQLNLTDAASQRGILFLEQLLATLAPKETALMPNYPNPFNPETWIPYRLAEDAFVTLTIYDQSGQVVRTLEIGHRIAAFYETRSKAIHWDGRNEFGEQVASGVYFYHLSAGDYSATRKMLVLK